jgi:hypothetical protein
VQWIPDQSHDSIWVSYLFYNKYHRIVVLSDAKYARVIGSIDNAWHNFGFISKIGWCDKLEQILTFFPIQFGKANGNKSAALLVPLPFTANLSISCRNAIQEMSSSNDSDMSDTEQNPTYSVAWSMMWLHNIWRLSLLLTIFEMCGNTDWKKTIAI